MNLCIATVPIDRAIAIVLLTILLSACGGSSTDAEGSSSSLLNDAVVALQEIFSLSA